MDQDRDSKHYHDVKYKIFFTTLLIDLAFLIIFFSSGLSTGLRNGLVKFFENTLWVNVTYLACFAFLTYVLHIPLRWFEDFRWEHHFGLSNQRIFEWLWDDFKKGIMGLILIVFSGSVIYMILERFPEIWWMWAGVFWLFLTLFLARITPDIIIPIFYKYSSIENQELRRSILAIFKETQVAIKDAYMVNFSAKTKKANAFICGLGKSRRVVLSDNLVNSFSIPEIETVVAHELGHYKHHDMLKLTVVNAAVTFLGFYLVDKILKDMLTRFQLPLADIASFPVVLLTLMILSFLMMPLLNGFSRRLEVAADRFSLELTKKPQDFITMIRKLGEMNLAQFDPPPFIEFLFYSHPPISKRVKFAQSFLILENK